jgi:hypothetical protein
MKGIYRIYLDGEMVSETENLITTAGKKSILRYLAGQIPDYAGAIAIGAATNAANVADTYMGFEIARAPIQVKSVKDYTNNDIVFRASLPSGLACSVRELGLLTSINNAADRGTSNAIISRLDSAGEGWAVTAGPALSSDTTNSRLGADALRINTIPLSTTSTISLDTSLSFSRYVGTDRFHLMMGTFDTNCQDVTVSFFDPAGNSTSYMYTPATHTAGGGVFQSQILSVPFSSFTNWANQWINISRITISTRAKAAGATSVLFDGLNVTDSNTLDENAILVSRAIPTAVTKAANVEMDVEYTLRFTL